MAKRRRAAAANVCALEGRKRGATTAESGKMGTEAKREGRRGESTNGFGPSKNGRQG
jgi:hypothetical protein